MLEVAWISRLSEGSMEPTTYFSCAKAQIDTVKTASNEINFFIGLYILVSIIAWFNTQTPMYAAKISIFDK